VLLVTALKMLYKLHDCITVQWYNSCRHYVPRFPRWKCHEFTRICH